MIESPAGPDDSFGTAFMSVRRQISAWQVDHALLSPLERASGPELLIVLRSIEVFEAMQSKLAFVEDKVIPGIDSENTEWHPQPETTEWPVQEQKWDPAVSQAIPSDGRKSLPWHDSEGRRASTSGNFWSSRVETTASSIRLL